MIEYIIEIFEDRTEWYVNDQRHRNGEPDIVRSDGAKYWYQHTNFTLNNWAKHHGENENNTARI